MRIKPDSKSKVKQDSDYRESVERFRRWQSVNAGKVRAFDSPRQERKFSKSKLKESL